MKFILFAAVTFFLSGCTLSFTNVSTHGTASDVVDDTQSAEPNIAPTLTVPLK